MALDDLPLHTTPPSGPTPPLPRPRTTSPLRGAVVLVAAVAVGGALAFWWMSRAQPDEALPAPTVASDGARVSNRPQRQPLSLPALDGSDGFFRDLVALLSRHPTLARVLATEGVVRQAALAVVQLGEGRTPAQPLRTLRPPTRLAIVGAESGTIDPRSYDRWATATDALLSVNPREAAQLYVNVKPLFDSAYGDLGHPNGDFDVAITQAIRVLVATPEPTADPVLLRRPGFFEHTDAQLRALRPAQKQLLLLGPTHRSRVLAWLRQLATALDLPVTP